MDVCNNIDVESSVRTAESYRKEVEILLRKRPRGGMCNLYAGCLENRHGENVLKD